MRSLILGACLTTIPVAALSQSYDIAPELWDRPRTAVEILGHQTLRKAVLAALGQPDSQIVIHHAAGTEPVLQAEELRSWLGALAVDPQRIALRSDLPAGTPLRIEVTP